LKAKKKRAIAQKPKKALNKTYKHQFISTLKAIQLTLLQQ